MKKVRIYQRKNRPGYYVEWREGKDRKSKQCNTKEEAEHYAHLRYMQLNSDVYDSIDMPFEDARKEYLQKYDIKGLSAGAKYEATRTLGNFERICGAVKSKQINQGHIDSFILARSKECKSKHTLNKDISRLRAFLNWLAKRNYSTGKFDIELSKAPPVTVKALSTAQIRRLLKACPTPEWYVRTLLSLVTGLRASDIDNLNINMVDTTEMSVFVVEKKTSKPKTYPLPNKIKPILAKYLNGREKMFSSTNRSSLDKQWRKFRPEPITRQDLRRTNKTLLQKIGSIGSVQELLHSDLKVTTEYYTDQELILRWKVDQLPVKEWLSTLQ